MCVRRVCEVCEGCVRGVCVKGGRGLAVGVKYYRAVRCGAVWYGVV